MKYCRYCGEKLRDESKFCYHCGQPCAPPPEGKGADRAPEAKREEKIPDFLAGPTEAPDPFRDREDFREADGLTGAGEETGGGFEDEDAFDEPDEFYDQDDGDYDFGADHFFDRGDEDEDLSEPIREEAVAPPRKRVLAVEDDEEESDSYDEDEGGEYAGETRSRSPVGWIVAILVVIAMMIYVYWSPARRAFMYACAGAVDDARAAGAEAEQYVTERGLLRLLSPFGINHVFDSYNGGGITYEDAEARIGTLGEIGAAGKTAERRLNQLSTLYDSKVAFISAEKAREQGELRQAILLYGKVVREDKNYPEAVRLGGETETAYVSEVLKAAQSPSGDEEMQAAIASLTEALQALPDNQELKDRLTSLRQFYASSLKAEAVPTAESYIEQGFYKEAIDLLDAALAYNQKDDDLLSLKNTAIQNYEDFVTNQVSIYLGNKDLKGAVALLKKAMADMPDSRTVAQLYETVRET